MITLSQVKDVDSNVARRKVMKRNVCAKSFLVIVLSGSCCNRSDNQATVEEEKAQLIYINIGTLSVTSGIIH